VKEIRLIIKCSKHLDHQKILRFDAGVGMAHIETVAAILDGTSKHYIHRPQAGSPIGKCVICREPISTEIEERIIAKRRPQEYSSADS
jgi:hypothetical protein